MKRLLIILASVMLPLIASAALAGPYDSASSAIAPESGKSSCQDKLGNNGYDCTVVASNGAPFSDCFQFVSPGRESTNFDMFPVYLGALVGCSCDPKGSATNPKFNTSANSFSCAGYDGIQARAWSGKVSNKSLKGHVAGALGESYTYTCKKRSSPCPL